MLSVVENTPPETAAKKKKIAIVGTAPQWELAPFNDPDWEIWGILGISTCGKRLTRLYELHKAKDFLPLIATAPHAGKYWPVADALGENFITQDAYPEAPRSKRFDFEAKIKKYGNYFTSSAAWMIADAIDEDPSDIGIFGVNMAHDSEYGYQKPGCTYLLGYAKAKGIRITIPSGSELLAAPYQYGYQDPPRAISCFDQKEKEYQNFRNLHMNSLRQAELNLYAADQCLSLMQWFKQNWHTPDASTQVKT